MIRILGIASLALAVISSVSGHVIRHRGPPSGWQTGILQKYGDYHTRYLKWKCDEKHNTTYFDTCCHPLLKGEPLSVLDNLDCDEECEDGSSSVPNLTSYPPAAVTPSPEQYTPTSSPPVPATSSHAQDKLASPSPVYTPSPEPSKSVEHSHTPAPASPKASPTDSGSSGGDWITGGFATFFYQNGVAGACGTVHQDTDFVAAMDSIRYGDGSLCGKKVEIINLANGNSVTVTIEDSCPTCNNDKSIDLSVAAFKALDNLSVGQLNIKWRNV